MASFARFGRFFAGNPFGRAHSIALRDGIRRANRLFPRASDPSTSARSAAWPPTALEKARGRLTTSDNRSITIEVRLSTACPVLEDTETAVFGAGPVRHGACRTLLPLYGRPKDHSTMNLLPVK